MSSQELPRRWIDVTATLILAVGHVALAIFSTFWVMASVMGLDPCGYVECGEEKWAGVGVYFAIVGSLVLLFADWCVIAYRWTAGKPA